MVIQPPPNATPVSSVGEARPAAARPAGFALDSASGGDPSWHVVEIIAVENADQRRAFVRSAARFYHEHPAWVPPLESDHLRLIDPARSEFLHTPGNAMAFFLARRDGAAVGRIGAFRNEAHLATHGDGAGFFGFFECEDNTETARALLARAEAWLAAQGLRTARGPANFTIQEEAGVLLDGFEHQPMAGMAYTPPGYARLIEAAGYGRCRDLLVYRMDAKTARFDQVERIVAAATRRPGLTIRPLNMKRIPEEAKFFAQVFAEAWRDNWGVVPISAQEFREAYERYRLFLVPELAWLAEVDGEPAAVMVTMPDMNVLIKRIGGRLWPLGWLRLLLGRRGVTRFRTFMLGVRPAYRRLGLPLAFLAKTRAELLKRGPTLLEFSWVLEDNWETRGLIERLGGWRAQTLRLYEKTLP